MSCTAPALSTHMAVPMPDKSIDKMTRLTSYNYLIATAGVHFGFLVPPNQMILKRPIHPKRPYREASTVPAGWNNNCVPHA